MTRACWCAAASTARFNREPGGSSSFNDRHENMRDLRVEKSVVVDPKQCGTCHHCGAPIELGMTRWMHVGHLGELGTFALGCSRPCAHDAAVSLLELADDVREAQRCNGKGE